MASNIAVVQIDSGVILDLPRDTVTFDTPHGYAREAAALDLMRLEFSRTLSQRAVGEEFLVPNGSGDVARRGEMVLFTVDPQVSS